MASSVQVQPDAILEWLQKEMGYRPLGPFSASWGKSQFPSVESVRKVCRGNMMSVWSFLITRVKSEKIVRTIRKNIVVHGGVHSGTVLNSENEEGRRGGERGMEGAMTESCREAALLEREVAAKEAERLRNVLRRSRKELRARMIEVSKEEAERKRMLDEHAKNRHLLAILEAYNQQCEEAVKIFAEYHKRLTHYVTQARDIQRCSSIDASSEVVSNFSLDSEKDDVYSTVKGDASSEDVIIIETTLERNVRKACESLAMHMTEKIRNCFPAYEGSGIHLDPQLDATSLSIDFDGEVPHEVAAILVNCLKNPQQLLNAIAAYSSQMKNLVSREVEKCNVKADVAMLRIKCNNKGVVDVQSPNRCLSLSDLYGNRKNEAELLSRGPHAQLLERQKAHVQQFLATEDALNKAEEARNTCEGLLASLHESGDGGTSHHMGSLRQLELDLWAKEREDAGLKASINILMSEIFRLNKLCAEGKEAEELLRKKWKKIEEFDARRSEVEFIYATLLKANVDAAAYWNQQSLIAKEYALAYLIPSCTAVMDTTNCAMDLIDEEVATFSKSPDNSLHMIPSTPQALLEFFGSNGSAGVETVAQTERRAALWTARASAKDPLAIPSICRISAAFQYPAGSECSDAGLASVLESLEFCLKLGGSEANVLEGLEKTMDLVHMQQDLVSSSHSFLNHHASCVQQDYQMTTNSCLRLASDQKLISQNWLPELKTAVLNAQKCLDDCKYVTSLLDEWWEQPAGTIVDWVTVDGQDVATWNNHMKQLLTFYDKQLL